MNPVERYRAAEREMRAAERACRDEIERRVAASGGALYWYEASHTKRVRFLHRRLPDGALRSYGLHVHAADTLERLMEDDR